MEQRDRQHDAHQYILEKSIFLCPSVSDRLSSTITLSRLVVKNFFVCSIQLIIALHDHASIKIDGDGHGATNRKTGG